MRNADDTKRRLLAAAKIEFADFGFAGARVDRIAASADCNKQAIYAYFESKEGLFEAVYNDMVVRTIASVPMNAYDLPQYAGKLFDYYRAHPDVLRLAFWYQLERTPETDLPSAAVLATRDKLTAIHAAQRDGAVNASMKAEHLLALIIQLSTVAFQESSRGAAAKPSGALRHPLIDAVARLIAP